MKRFLCLIAVLFVPVMACADGTSLSTLVTVQNVPFEQCTKNYDVSAENLFYLTLASINANRFRIDEIQSKTGYIMFNAVNKEFLASIVSYDGNNALLKITPVNNVYYFPPGIVLNLFKYIDVNKSVQPVALKVN